MKIESFIESFYKKYIDMVDRILPNLPVSEQVVFNQIFARTIAAGETKCQLSYKSLSVLTKQSLETVKKALSNLEDKGFIRVVREASPRVAKVYEILWPSSFSSLSRFQRDSAVILKDMGLEGKQYKNILDRLDKADREMLEVIRESLSAEEEARLRKMAKERAKTGDDINKIFLELIVLTQFGPARLKKYEIEEYADVL